MKLTRRTFLRVAGVSLALPLLEANAAAPPTAAQRTPPPRRRMVCINTSLGLHPAAFFPETAGKDYKLSPYLEVVKDFREDFTVISGLSHPDVGPGHDSNYSFLTGAPHPGQRAGFKNTISLDQVAAELLHGQTRFAIWGILNAALPSRQGKKAAADAEIAHTPAYKRLTRALRQARERAGLTQGEVAARLGTYASFVSKCESGERRLDVLELAAFCRLYKVDLVTFLRSAGLAS
jgi:DNA-binding transcriptional regulator YiaG